MIKNIGLIVAQVANRVLAIVRVLEGTDPKERKSVEVENLFEIPYFVVRNVQFF